MLATSYARMFLPKLIEGGRERPAIGCLDKTLVIGF